MSLRPGCGPVDEVQTAHELQAHGTVRRFRWDRCSLLTSFRLVHARLLSFERDAAAFFRCLVLIRSDWPCLQLTWAAGCTSINRPHPGLRLNPAAERKAPGGKESASSSSDELQTNCVRPVQVEGRFTLKSVRVHSQWARAIFLSAAN